MPDKLDQYDIIDLRKRSGMKQSEFATYLGVDKQTVNRWEKGKRRPSKLAMRQLHRLHEKLEAEGNHPKGVNNNVSANPNG